MPYIGYWQLMKSVDKFVIYDNIEFTKKGWINRNRILVNHKESYFTLPLKKDSDYLNINERFLTDSWDIERVKLLNKLRGAYIKAPNFKIVFNLIEEILMYNNRNLFDFIYNSIQKMSSYLEIETPIIVSSSLNVNEQLKSKDRVIETCKLLEASTYTNPSGGTELYKEEDFKEFNIQLQFIDNTLEKYKQFGGNFVPYLSIIDVLMFNSREDINNFITQYSFRT